MAENEPLHLHKLPLICARVHAMGEGISINFPSLASGSHVVSKTFPQIPLTLRSSFSGDIRNGRNKGSVANIPSVNCALLAVVYIQN